VAKACSWWRRPTVRCKLRQDAQVSRLQLGAQGTEVLPLLADRSGYLHVVGGRLCVDGEWLGQGDGAAFRNRSGVAVQAGNRVEALWFDLPGC